MENIELKKVKVRDIETLRQIGKQTFAETFLASNSQENMAKYLEDKFSVLNMNEESNNNADSQFYFAVMVGQVVGYLKLNSEKPQCLNIW